LIVDGLPNRQVNISIYNSEGKEVFRTSQYKVTKLELDLKTFSAGVYFLNIQDEKNNVIRKKFTKM